LTHINEHNSRRNYKSGATLNNYNVSDYDNNNRDNSHIEFNSENLAQSFGISKRSPVKKIRGNPLIADISEYRFQYDDINAKGLTSYD
jgi:hypothetical protein